MAAKKRNPRAAQTAQGKDATDAQAKAAGAGNDQAEPTEQAQAPAGSDGTAKPDPQADTGTSDAGDQGDANAQDNAAGADKDQSKPAEQTQPAVGDDGAAKLDPDKDKPGANETDEGDILEVRTRRGVQSFRRAGRRFSREPTLLKVADLSPEQLLSIQMETRLEKRMVPPKKKGG